MSFLSSRSRAIARGFGKPLTRQEDPRLITGRGRFSDDVNLPGQAHACFVRSPHAHARIARIDTGRRARPARRARGADRPRCAADGLAADPAPSVCRRNPTRVPAARAATARASSSRRTRRCRPTRPASSARRSRWSSPKPRRWRPTRPSGSGRLRAAARGHRHPRPRRSRERRVSGTRSAPMCASIPWPATPRRPTPPSRAAAHVVRLETWVHRITGVPMEPRAALGVYDPATGRYTVYAGSGGSVRQQDRPRRRARRARRPRSAWCRSDVGGNFGTRNSIYPEFALVAWAARRLGRPVKWTCDRRESFLSDYQARDLVSTQELALDADGRFLALRGTNTSNRRRPRGYLRAAQQGLAICPPPSTACRPPRMRGRAVHQQHLADSPPTAARAGRRSMFVIERLIDLAARRHGFDRVALRRRNLVPPGAMPYRIRFGIVYDSGDYPAAQDRRARTGRLGRLRGAPRGGAAARPLPRHRPRQLHRARHRRAARAGAGHRAAGRHRRAWSSARSRRARATRPRFAQLIAEWLGVEPERVRLITGDTDRVAVGGGSHSGRSMRLGGVVMAKASDRHRGRGAPGSPRGCSKSAVQDVEFADRRFARPRHRPRGRSLRGRGRRARRRTRRPTCAGRSRASATRR